MTADKAKSAIWLCCVVFALLVSVSVPIAETRGGAASAVRSDGASGSPASDPGNVGHWVANPAWTDEFHGQTLDAVKWRPFIEGWPGRPPALFKPGNIAVHGGMLRITMRRDLLDPRYGRDGFVGYSTGAVESIASELYGYIEVRARAMHCAGASAVWLAAQSKGEHNEIDVAEMGGDAPADPHRVYSSLHVFEAGGKVVHLDDRVVVDTPYDVSSALHTYGLDWERDFIDFYLDGVRMRHVVNDRWRQPMVLILDAEIERDWFGMPTDADLPAEYDIASVRAWKHAH